MLKIFCHSFVLMLLFSLANVQAAQLTDVRVGVHPRYTRIVFEINGEAIIEGPVNQGPKRSSLKLINTQNAFKSTLPSYAKANVDRIDLIRDGEDLIVHIRMGFPYLKIRSFFLPNPQRVVLDIYQASDVFEKIENQKIPADGQESNPIIDPGVIDQPTVVALSALEPTEKTEPQLKSSILPPKTSSISSSEISLKPGENPPPKQPAQVLEVSEKSDVDLANKRMRSSFLQSETALQIYLVAILFFAVLALSLLFFLVFKKDSHKVRDNFQTMSSEYKLEKTLEMIDKRINNKLHQLSQKLRLKGP